MLQDWLYKLYLLKYIEYTTRRFVLCKLAITEHKNVKQKT